MRLGILNAIDPAKSGVDWNKTPFDSYVRFLDEIGCNAEYVHYLVALGDFPAAPHECDAYIITGSPNGAYEELAWINSLAQFIRDCYAANVKMVGICFGHQILAQALGGRVEKSEKGWGFGEKPFTINHSNSRSFALSYSTKNEVLKQNLYEKYFYFSRGAGIAAINHKKAWMGDTPSTCSLYFAHQDQVMALPLEAELLGGSDFCPIGLYTIENKVLAMQGHPEFTPSIMEDIRVQMDGSMDEEMYKTAVSSLQNPNPDRAIAGQWIYNFLKG